MDFSKESTEIGVSNLSTPSEPSSSQLSLPPPRLLAQGSNPNIVDVHPQSSLLVNPAPSSSTLPASDSPSVKSPVLQQVSVPVNTYEVESVSTASRSTSSPRPEAVQIDEMCPSCLSPNIPLPPGYQKRSKEFRKNEDILIWISCSHCEDWYHWPCVRSRNQGIPSALEEDKGDWKAQVEMIDKWYCPNLTCSGPTSGYLPTLKSHPSRRASSRPKPVVEYNAPSPPLTQSSPDWISLYQKFETQGRIVTGDYTEMLGPDVTLQWLIRDGCASGWYDRHSQGEGPWAKPIVVREVQGAPAGAGIESLGGKMPKRSLTVAEIAEWNGRDTKVEVMDVSNQSSSKAPPDREKSGSEEEIEKSHEGWTLGDWSEYFQKGEEARGGEVFNVISYEVSGTQIGDLITPPKIVRDLDWTVRFWPTSDAKHKPKVQLYCLMSPAGSFTDWHIDFAASSVYYHVMSGQKVFYFIRPTKKNLDAYTRWSSSGNQAVSYLGDRVKETVWKVTLNEGDTMFIPSGYIHAVHTPVDTLVFGGNFLHSYNIPMQLQLHDIEIALEVPKKFRFPHFNKLCWHVAEHYKKELQARQKIKTSRKTSHPMPNTTPTPLNDSASHLVTEPFTPRLLDNLYCLSVYLMRQVRPRERGSNVESVEPEIPFDKIKDPGAVARELRWRVQRAMGEESEDETEDYTAVSDKSAKRELSIGNHGDEKVSSLSSETLASVPISAEFNGGAGKKRHSLETKPEEDSHKKQKLEGNGMEDFASKDQSTWDADETTQPIIRTRTVTLPRPGGPIAQPEQALESYRSESQIQTRKRTTPDGGIVVEYSGTTKVVVKTTWASSKSGDANGKGIKRASHNQPNSACSMQQANTNGFYSPSSLIAANPNIQRPIHPTPSQRPHPVQPIRPSVPSALVRDIPISGLQRPSHPVQPSALFPLPPPPGQRPQYPSRQGQQQTYQQPRQQNLLHPSQPHPGYTPPSLNHSMNSTPQLPTVNSETVPSGPQPASISEVQPFTVQPGRSRPQLLPPSASPVSSNSRSTTNQRLANFVSPTHTTPSSRVPLQRQNVQPSMAKLVHLPQTADSGSFPRLTSPQGNLATNQAIVSNTTPSTSSESMPLNSRGGVPPILPSVPEAKTSVPVKRAGPHAAQSLGPNLLPSVELATEIVAQSIAIKSPSTRSRAVKSVPMSDTVLAPVTSSTHVHTTQVVLPSPKTPITAKASQSSSPRNQKSSPAMTMNLRNHPNLPVVPPIPTCTPEVSQESKSTNKVKPTATPKKVGPPLTNSTPMTTRQRSSEGHQPVINTAQSIEEKLKVASVAIKAPSIAAPAPVTTSSENRRRTRSSHGNIVEADSTINTVSPSPNKLEKASTEASPVMNMDVDDSLSLSELSEEGE